MKNMFKNVSDDVNKMIELSREIGCLDTEYKYISNLSDNFNYNEEKAHLIRIRFHEMILELDKHKNKYND